MGRRAHTDPHWPRGARWQRHGGAVRPHHDRASRPAAHHDRALTEMHVCVLQRPSRPAIEQQDGAGQRPAPSVKESERTMHHPNRLSTLARAALLALAVLGVPAGLVHAEQPRETFETCDAKGLGYDSETRQCLKNCEAGGKIYRHGDHRLVYILGGGVRLYECDGRTGLWISIRTTSPTGPAAPGGNGTVAPANTTPTGPVGPRPTTNAR